MFSFCTEPDTLDTARWMACYLTTGKHFGLYWSFLTVLTLLAITAPTARRRQVERWATRAVICMK